MAANLAMVPTSRALSHRFDINAATERLLRAIDIGRDFEFKAFERLRDAGNEWIAICAWCDDRAQHGGKRRLSAATWAKEHIGISKKWLDEHAKFARAEWSDFVAAWSWAGEAGWAPERRPSLQVARDLIDTKRRVDGYHSAYISTRSPVRIVPVKERAAGEPINVSEMTTILPGDATEMLRQHVADDSIDVCIADPPFNMGVPNGPTLADHTYKTFGGSRRFRAEWDNFDSYEQYEQFNEEWATELARCLKPTGSTFVFVSWHCIEPICRALRLAGLKTVQHVQVIKKNGRPASAHRGFQFSSYTLVWACKEWGKYHFNNSRVKLTAFPDDPFNDVRGKMMRDVWQIPINARESIHFPAQKMIRVYDYIMTATAQPGGTMLDLFAGSGTGALSALKWGMRCISIERDADTIELIIKRLHATRPTVAK